MGERRQSKALQFVSCNIFCIFINVTISKSYQWTYLLLRSTDHFPSIQFYMATYHVLSLPLLFLLIHLASLPVYALWFSGWVSQLERECGTSGEEERIWVIDGRRWNQAKVWARPRGSAWHMKQQCVKQVKQTLGSTPGRVETGLGEKARGRGG